MTCPEPGAISTATLTMETCDVLIVGGGPAGSTLAWKLGVAGLDVMVIDKAPFPRDKVCAGWITPAVISSLELDIQDYARENIIQPINGFRVARLGASHTETHYDETVSYGIRRREFDHYLLERSGSRATLGESVQSIQRDRQCITVNSRIKTRLLIGAGGHFCPVARFLDNKPGSRETAVTAQEVEFLMHPTQESQCRIKANIPELYFCKDLMGYAWVFRKGNYLNIGLGREDNHKLSAHVSNFVEQLKTSGRIPKDIPGRFHGHAYLLYGHSLRNYVDDNVLLIGDAMGLAYPQSGEGIRPAVESAILAANVILQAKGDYSLSRLASYKSEIVNRFGEMEGQSTADWLPMAIKQGIAGRLLANHWFARNIVIDKWFLHMDQAPLLSDPGTVAPAHQV